MYKRILLASDGSPSSLKAAAAAANLARLTPYGSVTVLYVVHIPVPLATAWTIPVDSILRDNAGEVIEATRAALDLPAEQVHAEVEMGDPATEIVEMAKSGEFDLVVMGCRGLSPFSELLLGGVSHRVANTAPCPVLLVR